MTEAPIKTFEDFWPYYVREHSSALNRTLHFVGSMAAIAVLGAMILTGQWLLFFALPVAGYSFAWIGHFFIEKNRPATFTYPFWSLAADWKMVWMMLTGRMDAEVDRAFGRTPMSR